MFPVSWHPALAPLSTTASKQPGKRNGWNGLRKLGIPEEVVECMVIDPTPEILTQMKLDGKKPIPVYFEKRTDRDLLGYTITGKFDMCLDGELHDFKSTSVWSYIMGGKDEDYRFQGQCLPLAQSPTSSPKTTCTSNSSSRTGRP